MRCNRLILAVLSVTAAGLSSAQDAIFVIDSGNDKILKLNAFDGSVINANFIVDIGVGSPFNFQTPKGIATVGNEIWVSDQISDAVFRFDMNGGYLSALTGHDNIRGLNVVGSHVWVTSDDGIFRFDFAGNFINTIDSTKDFFDALPYNGEVIVANIGNDDLERYDTNGTFLGTFHASDGTTGIDFPQQLTPDTVTGGLLAGGFSAPLGVYQYNSSGTQTNYWLGTAATRGVKRLGNGTLLYTAGDAIYSLNTTTGVSTEFFSQTGGSYQYFSVGLAPVPEPATMTALGIGALALLRRRKKSK